MRVQHDEVEEHALAAQVFVRLEQVGEERELGAVLDLRRAGSGGRPRCRTSTAPTVRERFFCTASGRSQARIAEEQTTREPLEAQRVLDGQAEVPQLDLRVRAGQRDRASDGAPVVGTFR